MLNIPILLSGNSETCKCSEFSDKSIGIFNTFYLNSENKLMGINFIKLIYFMLSEDRIYLNFPKLFQKMVFITFSLSLVIFE